MIYLIYIYSFIYTLIYSISQIFSSSVEDEDENRFNLTLLVLVCVCVFVNHKWGSSFFIIPDSDLFCYKKNNWKQMINEYFNTSMEKKTFFLFYFFGKFFIKLNNYNIYTLVIYFRTELTKTKWVYFWLWKKTLEKWSKIQKKNICICLFNNLNMICKLYEKLSEKQIENKWKINMCSNNNIQR